MKKLTQLDRLMLSNQFKILRALYPDDADMYDEMLNIVERGYTGLYYELFEHIHEEVPQEVYDEVIDILNMYRAINFSFSDLSQEEKSTIPEHKLKFGGFDGNNEPYHRGIAIFLLNSQGRYQELQEEKSSYNTHFPTLNKYRRMLRDWSEIGKKDKLTFFEIRKLLNI